MQIVLLLISLNSRPQVQCTSYKYILQLLIHLFINNTVFSLMFLAFPSYLAYQATLQNNTNPPSNGRPTSGLAGKNIIS
jgi:hypothetical protein